MLVRQIGQRYSGAQPSTSPRLPGDESRQMKLFTRVLAAACLVISPAAAAPIVSYVLQSQSSDIERDVPATFGAVFAPGDVPSGVAIALVDGSGNPLPTQVDIKARNKDGSLRHAVVTVTMPRLPSGRDVTVSAVQGSPVQGTPVALSALPGNFDAVVDLNEGGNHLTASARDLIAHGKPDTWLAGPLVSEWWFWGPLRDASGKPDPLLTAHFGIRSYGPGRPLRIEVVVENTWTWAPHPRSRLYDAEIRIGGKSAFTQPHITQQAHTRWRQVFWWSTTANVFMRPDFAYLKKTRAVPNYDPDVRPPDAREMYQRYMKVNRGPMGPGVIYPGMGATGGRPDISPLPGWTVGYLMTTDPRFMELTMSAAQLAGSFSTHYRNDKTARPATSEDYPKISTHYNFVGRGNGNLELPDTAKLFVGLGAETSHEPSLDFIPYLVTGERYYLEELQFWSQSNAWETAPEYHGFAKGLVGWDQIRGTAWSLRTLAQAAYITPDADPLKGPLQRELHANAAWFDWNYTNNPNANVFHFAIRQSDDAQSVAPWMDDFLTWAAQYTVELGFDDFRPFARWKAYNPVQRMINPDFCYVFGTKYWIRVMDGPHSFLPSWSELYFRGAPKEFRDTRPKCGSEEMATALKLRPGEMMGDSRSPAGYPAQMQPALAAAVDAGVPGATQAWEKFRARPIRPQGGVDAQWAIVPRDSGR
jgi:hypothetical protein